jgi:hypothetical protein
MALVHRLAHQMQDGARRSPRIIELEPGGEADSVRGSKTYPR